MDTTTTAKYEPFPEFTKQDSGCPDPMPDFHLFFFPCWV